MSVLLSKLTDLMIAPNELLGPPKPQNLTSPALADVTSIWIESDLI